MIEVTVTGAQLDRYSDPCGRLEVTGEGGIDYVWLGGDGSPEFTVGVTVRVTKAMTTKSRP